MVSSKSQSSQSIKLSATVEKRTTVPSVFESEPKSKIIGKPVHYSDLTIGVLAEDFEGENRVSMSPESVRSLTKAGFTVVVQREGKCME